MNNDHLIINYFGGPAIGKTTACADLFCSLKKNGIDTQLVGEFAQECILEGNTKSLKDQIYIFGNTYHRILAAYEEAEVTIVDSPILLSTVYQTNLPPSFNHLVRDMHNRFHNLNVLLARKPDYAFSMVGRVHNLPESIEIDELIEAKLKLYNVPYVRQTDIEAEGYELTGYLTREILNYFNDIRQESIAR